ncbi:hypothetical protein DTO217A2_7884 [Paecilomyces variotii]|nr:hypothetical protein DTO217A2_7884 [Paecilomyces variotii]KAJ9395777.1 hypothetical protein DTO282F9_7266 [Paecilomyces variotii]
MPIYPRIRVISTLPFLIMMGIELNTLWEKVVLEKDVDLQEDEVTEATLEKYQIVRINCDFEKFDSTNVSLEPPVLFRPLSLEKLRSHPVDLQEHEVDFRDYNPPTDPEELRRGYWDPVDCAGEISRYLKALVFGFPVIGEPDLPSLAEFHGMSPVHYPNPLLLEDGGTDGRRWRSKLILEYGKEDDKPVYPHVFLMTLHFGNGKDDSMKFGELSAIITMMRCRANQPKVDEDDQELEPRQLEFEKEKRFPVLMVSVMGPQHGRMFYACMDGGTLVIRQSRLFSFERKDTAPWELFQRVIVSCPLMEA